MSDSMVHGRKIRTLNIIDDCNREPLAIEVDTSLSSKRVIRVLNKVIEQRGKPKVIRVDNGPEPKRKACIYRLQKKARLTFKIILHQLNIKSKKPKNAYCQKYRPAVTKRAKRTFA